MIISGKVLKYSKDEDDINTDGIWPGKYTYTEMDDVGMREHAMENYDPDFKNKITGKSVLVVGRNFGCGSSREQAVAALKASGIKVIVARSFARIYYRNAINLGVAVIESDALVDALQDGDDVSVNLEKGEVVCNGNSYMFAQYPGFVLSLIEKGGLIPMIQQQVKNGELR